MRLAVISKGMWRAHTDWSRQNATDRVNVEETVAVSAQDSAGAFFWLFRV